MIINLIYNFKCVFITNGAGFDRTSCEEAAFVTRSFLNSLFGCSLSFSGSEQLEIIKYF